MSPATIQPPGRFEWRGLLEGRVPPVPGFEGRLRTAEQEARAAGLPIELEFDGGRFGLLARLEPRAFDPNLEQPSERIGAWLEELLRAFPDRERAELSSTLRSSEQIGAELTETHFGLDPRRGLERLERKRSVDQPPRPFTKATRRRWKTWLPIAALGSLFGAWQAGWLAAPPSTLAVELAAPDFAEVLVISSFGIEADPTRLWIELAPGALAGGDRNSWLDAPLAPDRRTERAFAALVEGRAHLRWFDPEGRLLATREIPLEALWAGQPARLTVPWPVLGRGEKAQPLNVRLGL